MTARYTHTQIGHLVLWILLVLLLFYTWLFWIIAKETDIHVFIGAVMALVLVLLASFSTLTITINETRLNARFGYGIFQKKFLLADIVSIARVRNRWWYGWGIRVWFWPHMWIYCVSGFDAIEITMRNQKRYRIGTDEPGALEAALKRAVQSV